MTIPGLTSEQTRSNRILAIRGSRGGMGASMIATNLGIFLAQIGKRVLLVDADLSDGTMHNRFRQLEPERFIPQVLTDEMPIEKAATATDITGLYLLAGGRRMQGSDSPSAEQTDLLWHQLERAPVDLVVIDLPSNFSTFTHTLFARADISVAVTIPLPDAVSSTYRFLNANWFHQLTQLTKDAGEGVSMLISDAMAPHRHPVTPRQFTEELRYLEEGAHDTAYRLSASFHPQLIVNQIKLREDDDLGSSMVSAAARWCGINAGVLGAIGWDDNVWLAQRRSRVLLTEFARSQVCKDLEQVVRRVMSFGHSELSRPVAVPPPTESQTLYQLLEIYPGASEEEIRRAYKQIRKWFGVESLAIRGAASEKTRMEFEKRAERAHTTLLDRSLRRRYDRNHFPDGMVADNDDSIAQRESIAGTVAVTRESLPEVRIHDDDVVDGRFLAALRRKRGVELADISNRAKVSARYLAAIEEERFDDLPAAVFTRGFVMEFARFLKVDPRRAAQDFMKKFTTWENRKA
jgi:flagellar biosynthesis protein FlhG